MPKLFIIGNGFDLAHGYKTSYADYFKHLLETSLTDREKYSYMFKIGLKEKAETVDELLLALKKSPNSIVFSNLILEAIYSDFVNMNWSDIEEIYFSLLMQLLEESKVVSTVFKSAVNNLNDQFNQIKNSFEAYLREHVFISDDLTRNEIVNEIVNEMIQRLMGEDNNLMILNFNYSRIVNQYSANYTINIHGELDNGSNRIVFGYAAKEKDTRQLSDLYYDPVLQHIKQFMYATNGRRKMLKFLADAENDLDIIVLGHSCGMSDRLILGEIFNHSNIRSILPVYYKDHDNYRSQMFNIYRLMEEEKTFEKLIEFNSCPNFPQIDSDWGEENRHLASDYALKRNPRFMPGVSIR